MLRGLYLRFLEELMGLSRQYQESLMEGEGTA